MTYRVLFPCVIEGKAHIDGLIEVKTRDWYILKLLAAKMIEPIEQAPESDPTEQPKPKITRKRK